MHEKLEELANSQFQLALSKLPSDPLEKVALFLEAIRVLDYATVFQSVLQESDKQLSRPDFDIICWGWNLAMNYLFTPIKVAGIPTFASTQETRHFAIWLLHKFGQTVLLRRASAMVRAGFLQVQNTTNGYTVKGTGAARDQFLDNLEFNRWLETQNQLNDQGLEFHKGWQLFEVDDYALLKDKPGFFLGRTSRNPFAKYKSKNVDEQMLPLIHPWDSGRGIMMGYGALPEVDDHFLAEATEVVVRARNEAGLHPDTDLGNTTGADVTAIVTFLTALHMKHIRFTVLAKEKVPEISIPQSLTIWDSLQELEDSLVDYSQLDREQIKNALGAIVLCAEDAQQLGRITQPVVPLLLNLGNGMILRPVSSIARNPFICVRVLLESRHPHLSHRISKPREDWLRSELYALFAGTRYKHTPGNIRLRHDQKVLTDIDAAVFDVLTGELALFQLKWQDYFTNDVRELRSKARNLTEELDTWAQKVDWWIQLHGTSELAAALGLKLNKGNDITEIYLFGLSHTYARMQGFGFPVTSEKLAIANWPQFLRNRCDMSPGKPVFSTLFQRLKSEINAVVNAKPMPFTIRVADKSICFEDLWSTFDVPT